MLKDYFTDGLIQIAIILSLLRIDIPNNLMTDDFNEIEEIYQGPTTAFAQTRFHHQNWNRDVGAFVHPKHVDNDIYHLLEEVHALGRFRNDRGLNTRIEAYLVSDPQPNLLASENANLSNEPDNNNHTDHNTVNNNGTASLGQGTNTDQADEPTKESSHPLGAELTKEDMDLIDILWRQDMDLGVGREMYDSNLRRELEKQQELEQQKQQQQELLKKTKLEEENEKQHTFTLDDETGELIPSEKPSPSTKQSSAPATVSSPSEQEDDLEAAIEIMANQMPETQPVQQQQPIQFIPQQSQQIERQTSYEQRWDDITNLFATTTNSTLPRDVDMPTVNADPLLQNASLAAPNNMTEFNMTDAPSMSVNESNFNPFNNSDLASPIGNGSLFGFSSEPLSFQNNQSMPAANDTNLFNSTTADSLLQELLADDNLDKMDFTTMNVTRISPQVNTNAADDASDSAVGSMTGSHSPSALSDSLSNVSSSSFRGIEGATGGPSFEIDPEMYTKVKPKKEIFDPGYAYTDYGFSEEDMALDTSSNDTEYKYRPGAEADPRQVSHNHTYPLQPGQQPRDKKLTAEEKRIAAAEREQLSRDHKKAKMLKIPISVDDIIHTPVEEFNNILQRYRLNEPQLQLIRDIRRRGKNKVAAQNCRKRKMEVIQTLEEEVNNIRAERDRLLRERSRLGRGAGEMKEKYHQLYKEVFHSLRDDNGHPYDPNQFSLQQTSDGNVFLVPVNSTSPARDHDEKTSHKRKEKKGGR